MIDREVFHDTSAIRGAMAAHRFAEEDAARMEWLNAQIAKAKAAGEVDEVCTCGRKAAKGADHGMCGRCYKRMAMRRARALEGARRAARPQASASTIETARRRLAARGIEV